ncbi:polysaccharide deacetylase family protein [Fusobacterium polymorphum]|uniref:polysaccharide deacetylase family protein n=1 Tax=Fusobacterium nucleatum subsp. polymorphum TaxID=76857 RepID=UPI0030089605
MKSEVTVVMYHYVRDLKNSRYPNIKGLDIEKFKKQIKFFKENYNFVRIEDLIEYYKNPKEKELPEKAILLTFDDGYKDHYTYVLPVLLENNIQGSFYIPTKCFQDKKVLDVNKIHFILESCIGKEERILKEIEEYLEKNKDSRISHSYNDYFKEYAVDSRFDKKEIIFIKRMLQVVLPEDYREKLVDILFKKYVCTLGDKIISERAFWEELYLTPEQIRMMEKLGMHIGFHSHNHVWLNSLSKEEQEFQIKSSINYFKEIGVKTEKMTISYPYGGYNKETIKLMEEYKIPLGFTTEVRKINLENDSFLELPRMDTNDFIKE